MELAVSVSHFEDYLELVHEYRSLEQKLKSPSNPPIATKIQTPIPTEHNNLQQQYIKVKRQNARLRQENHNYLRLIPILSSNKPFLLSFMGRILNL